MYNAVKYFFIINQNYNSLKGKFDEFYAIINEFKTGIDSQSQRTTDLDKKNASNL